MHDERKLIEDRLARVLRERIRPAVYPLAVPLQVQAWHTDDGPVEPAVGLAGPYARAAVGDAWGPPWGTTWFHFTGQVPGDWVGKTVEAVIDLGFSNDRAGFAAEGLVYLPDRQTVKGLHPRSRWLRIAERAKGAEQVDFYVEAAANPDINPPITALGDHLTAGAAPLYRLDQADLTVFDPTVWDLVQDLEVLAELMPELSHEQPRRWEILYAVNACLDALDLQDINGSAGHARELLAPVLASPAHASAHRVSAVGHAHIDSAWLWPLRETVRKVARTSSNMVELMREHPDFRFAMSQAQQFAWIQEFRPEVFDRVKEKVADGQFLPVGGMWVEADTNLPGSEALARQFVHGKRYFAEQFGVNTEEVWLPDSFGYSAALPQLVKLSGSKWFLTQKISWSQTNAFPHHSFWWEGIDGTRTFTHFPPVDTYNSELLGSEMAHLVRNFRDKGRTRYSMVPFGYGDGGGGPTREMLARASRLRDLEGSARVELETPAQFFEKAEADYTDAPVWVGELYLEYHRGTYTSQAKTKQGNRRSEHLLREAELWAATATVRTGHPYPYDQLDRLWKIVLLHQFHDILPGTSIAWVHREARHTYEGVAAELHEIISDAQQKLAGDGDRPVVFNAAPHARAGIAAGAARIRTNEQPEPPAITEDDRGWALRNESVRIQVNAQGLVTSAVDLSTGREAVAPGTCANLLQLHPDLPITFDAWDIESYYRNTVTDLTELDRVEVDRVGAQVTLRLHRSFGNSTVVQQIALRAGSATVDFRTEVDWRETETLLKVAFPLDIRAAHSTAEIQFGHVDRPTHTNTSWDVAKFEICAHRYLHLAEPGYGAAVVNDSTYGHDVTRDVRPDGGTTTTARLSLLRAPRYPDPETDQGSHSFGYALVPGATVTDARREGFRINLPERTVVGNQEVDPLIAIDNQDVVLEAVKLADDQSGDVIVRLYEASGARATALLTPGFPVAEVLSTDLLERPYPGEHLPHGPAEEPGIRLRLRPFQILTLRLRRESGREAR